MIRDAVPEDAVALERIQRDALVSPWPELLETAIRTRDPRVGPRCLVATPLGSDAPVGYVLAVENDASEQCYVAEIAVDPEHRRVGYGSALLDAIAERTTAKELFLTARADDATATAFYEAYDFRVVDRLPDHYDDDGPRDGLLLEKRLTPDEPSWDRTER